MKKNQGVLIAIAIIVVVAVVLFVRQQGVLFAPKIGDLGSANGEDVCPNPKNSVTACVDDSLCECKTSQERWIAPKGKTCVETKMNLCEDKDVVSNQLRNVNYACTGASRTVVSPGMCSSNCQDTGIIDEETKTSTCCTVTKARNCVPKTSGTVAQ